MERKNFRVIGNRLFPATSIGYFFFFHQSPIIKPPSPPALTLPTPLQKPPSLEKGPVLGVGYQRKIMGKIEEQIPQKYVSCLSVDCQLTVGRLSAKRLPFVIGLVLPVCRLSVGRLLVKSLLTNSQKIFGAAILQIYQMMVILKL